ncbi:MAG TPA: alkaline phosphatase family protein [Cyclobacteriaceae bacterium]|nr:alkaline phosphatase family protein [Cyclobacteriaceae bacterium]
MKAILLSVVVLCFSLLIFTSCKVSSEDKKQLDSIAANLEKQRVMLPNGWSISPAGKNIPLGDLPLNAVISPDGRTVAIVNNGVAQHSIMLLDAESETIVDEMEIDKAWYGLAFNTTGNTLYVSGGNDNRIMIYNIREGKIFKTDSIILGRVWPKDKIFPTGIALDERRNVLYIPTKDDSSLYIADLKTKISKKISLGHEAYSCILTSDQKTLYISLWGGRKVGVFDTNTQQITNTIPVGDHPNDLTLTRDGSRLFVSHSNDNGVSIIETSSGKVSEVLNTALFPNSPAGSTPNAVALSEDESRLYIANADNNCLAVFDVTSPGKSKSLGFIPTGWYPTSVKVLNHKILVTNGKGGSSRPNPKGPSPYTGRESDEVQYIGSLLKGTLSIMAEPGEELLKIYSGAVYKNSPYNKEIEKVSAGEEGNPIPRKADEKSPIKYVFYVIKENRTYDQVLGDLPEGNGDSSLCLFPRKVTPNQHALVENFVLLDNFYVDAEVSADGHNWSMSAYATDFVEKVWPTSYGGRGGSFDYAGSRTIAFPHTGYIWDYCQRAGVSYRSYGEFSDAGENIPSLQGHIDMDYIGWDLATSDVTRYAQWQHDFDSLLAAHALPQLSIIALPNDHSAGARVGELSPRAYVAQNDLAVGKLIEHISASKIWNESAIFILEDDAQNGPDHVDAHRSTAYVISPYVKRNKVVSRAYSTSSMLRTIELILGLPPMSQYDAAATPMWECFTSTPDFKGFAALPATYNINEVNKDKTTLSEQSARFNLAQVDAVPDLEFSIVIWKSIKGLQSEMPPPVRSAFVKAGEEEGEDDDD